jgi:hypothetical protein
VITARLPVKLAALFFSLVLWLMVGAEEPTDEWVDVRIALVMDSTVALRDSTDLPRVQALVVGRARELLQLYTERPVIRRMVTADTPDAFTLDLRPEDVILPANVTARVTDVRPRSIPLSFSVTASRRVPVRSAIRATADSGILITGNPRIDPESVMVRGSRSAVRGLSAVPTERVVLVVRDTIGSRMIRLDTTGLGVTVTPAEVRVRVPAMHDTTPPPPFTSPRSDTAAKPRKP